MLTYRGDRLVKGKKFTIKESECVFQKRDSKDRLIFESSDNQILKLTEEEFNNSYNNPEDEEAVSIVKAWNDGDESKRQLASFIISNYAMDDNFPKLQEYLKSKMSESDDDVNNYEAGSIESSIQDVARDYGISFENDTPFEYFYAPDSDDDENSWYSENYDYVAFYDKVLQSLGYGENKLLNDFKAEVHEVSDGKYEMTLDVDGKKFTIDIRAWDKKDDIKDNVYYILGILNDEVDEYGNLKEGLKLSESEENLNTMVETTNDIIDTTTEEVCNDLYEEEAITFLGLDADVWVHHDLDEKVLPIVEKAIRAYADKLKDVMKDELNLISQGLK